jgi:bis(5'-nucleosyl)-tetraphosphatase (symmetrical)
MPAMRWVIGDIQGCARELDDLLAQVRFDPTRDVLWSAGDLVNRGPDSLAALRLWRDCAGRAVLGNHDVYALRVHAGHKARKDDTLEALLTAADAAELLAAVRAQPVLVRLEGAPQETWLVHAGVHPHWDDLAAVEQRLSSAVHNDDWLRSDDVAFCIRVRCCLEDGTLLRYSGPPERCPPPYRPWDALYRGTARIVHGHWATRGHYRGPRTIGLDSGCVYGGPLTAWCLEEDRIVQVPSRAFGAGVRFFDTRGTQE